MIKRFAAATLTLLLAGCMSAADSNAVEAAAASFHDLQAAGDDNGIYQAASAGFRANAHLEDLTRLNNAVRNVRGCQAPSRDPSTFNNTVNTSGHFISVVYNRQCADGPIIETFVFSMSGSTAQLYGYNVSGMALFPTAPSAPATPTAEAPPQTGATPSSTTTGDPLK